MCNPSIINSLSSSLFSPVHIASSINCTPNTNKSRYRTHELATWSRVEAIPEYVYLTNILTCKWSYYTRFLSKIVLFSQNHWIPEIFVLKHTAIVLILITWLPRMSFFKKASRLQLQVSSLFFLGIHNMFTLSKIYLVSSNDLLKKILQRRANS